jgi:hypothetical protein
MSILWLLSVFLQVKVWKNWMAMVPTSLATSSPPYWEHLAGQNPICVSQIHMTSDRYDDVCLCEFLDFCTGRVEVCLYSAGMVPGVLWQWWSQNVGRCSPCDTASYPRREETVWSQSCFLVQNIEHWSDQECCNRLPTVKPECSVALQNSGKAVTSVLFLTSLTNCLRKCRTEGRTWLKVEAAGSSGCCYQTAWRHFAGDCNVVFEW